MSEKPLLSGLQPGAVIAGASVVMFILMCKAYNIFLAKPKEQFSDLIIAKMAIIGIAATVLARVVITTLFEQRLSFASAVNLGAPGAPSSGAPTFTPVAPAAPPQPRITRIVPA
jgi:hypothetical protein